MSLFSSRDYVANVQHLSSFRKFLFEPIVSPLPGDVENGPWSICPADPVPGVHVGGAQHRTSQRKLNRATELRKIGCLLSGTDVGDRHVNIEPSTIAEQRELDRLVDTHLFQLICQIGHSPYHMLIRADDDVAEISCADIDAAKPCVGRR
jgi:hypothetical protein